MDEPEAAFSPQRQLALLALIRQLEDTKQAQFIIVTHSPILMAYPNCRLLYIEDGKIAPKDFRLTSHFQILARFFASPEKYLEKFFGD